MRMTFPRQELLPPTPPLQPHCAAGAWHGRGLVCSASSGKEGNRRPPEHALYHLRLFDNRLVMGIGMALLEPPTYDPQNGRRSTATLADLRGGGECRHAA